MGGGKANGMRSGTRHKFSKKIRKHGECAPNKYLEDIRYGDYVDIFCDPSQQKGMPYGFYHGRTGKVFHITRRAVGVLINRRINCRFIEKKVSVRIEHVRKSRCNEEFLLRKKQAIKLKEEAKSTNKKVYLKRQPEGPQPAAVVSVPANKIITVEPLPFYEEY